MSTIEITPPSNLLNQVDSKRIDTKDNHKSKAISKKVSKVTEDSADLSLKREKNGHTQKARVIIKSSELYEKSEKVEKKLTSTEQIIQSFQEAAKKKDPIEAKKAREVYVEEQSAFESQNLSREELETTDRIVAEEFEAHATEQRLALVQKSKERARKRDEILESRLTTESPADQNNISFSSQEYNTSQNQSYSGSSSPSELGAVIQNLNTQSSNKVQFNSHALSSNDLYGIKSSEINFGSSGDSKKIEEALSAPKVKSQDHHQEANDSITHSLEKRFEKNAINDAQRLDRVNEAKRQLSNQITEKLTASEAKDLAETVSKNSYDLALTNPVSLGGLLAGIKEDIPQIETEDRLVPAEINRQKIQTRYREEALSGVNHEEMVKQAIETGEEIKRGAFTQMALDSQSLSIVSSSLDEMTSKLSLGIIHEKSDNFNVELDEKVSQFVNDSLEEIKRHKEMVMQIKERYQDIATIPDDEGYTQDLPPVVLSADEAESVAKEITSNESAQKEMLKAQKKITPDAVSQLLF